MGQMGDRERNKDDNKTGSERESRNTEGQRRGTREDDGGDRVTH